jgi:hypothetical protein
MARYEVYGIGVESEVPLDADRLRRDRAVEVSVRLRGAGEVPERVPPGRLIARLGPDDRSGYAIVEDEQGYLYRFLGLADYRLSPGLDEVTVMVDRRWDGEWAAILLSGNVLGALVWLQGITILHASAVELDGRAIALVGGSGSGKTTLAALLCAHGARLVTDDALRFATTGSRVRCWTGPGPLRLRSVPAVLLDAGLRPTGVSADERTVIDTPRTRRRKLDLAAFVVPKLTREAETIEVTQLGTHRGLLELIRFPRILGWEAAEPSRQFLVDLAAAVERVPVVELVVPWRLAIDADLAGELANAVSALADGTGSIAR